MAFIQKLPRDVVMTEGCYGSRLSLRWYPESRSCDGTYSSMPSHDDMDLAETNSDIEMPVGRHSSGHAVLWARMTDGRDDGEAVLKGEWSHVTGGLMERGPFEMKLDEVSGAAEGWWSLSGDQTRNPWTWHPGEADTFFNAGLGQSPDGKGTRMRSSLSSRLDRSGSFFDALLEDEGGTAISIARYGVICAWICLIQTVAEFTMAAYQSSGISAAIVQCSLQMVYSVMYVSFLVIYSRMSTLPPWDYVLGMVLHTFGDIFFLLLDACNLFPEHEQSLKFIMDWSYLGGSLSFFFGSMLLVCATIPPAVPMLFRSATWVEHFKRFSFRDQQASLFWGSIAFVVGSAAFSLDSLWDITHAASKPAAIDFWCPVLGYGLWIPGRVYFLWGSTTDQCDMLLGRKSGRCFPRLPHCVTGLCRRRVVVFPDDELDSVEHMSMCGYPDTSSMPLPFGLIAHDADDHRDSLARYDLRVLAAAAAASSSDYSCEYEAVAAEMPVARNEGVVAETLLVQNLARVVCSHLYICSAMREAEFHLQV